jgi:hypothetical protein
MRTGEASSTRIRRAASTPKPPGSPPVGDSGTGRDGAASAPPALTDPADAFNEMARTAWQAQRVRLTIGDLVN